MTLTPTTPAQAIDAIADAYEAEIGGEIPARLLLALCAQWAIETRRGRAMYAYNFGNMRGRGDAGTTRIEGADEIIDGRRVVVPDGFAAYSSRQAGARAYVRYLCCSTRPGYVSAVAAATRGDLPGFVHGLKAGGYFTAGESRYASAEEGAAHYLEQLPAMHAWLETVP